MALSVAIPSAAVPSAPMTAMTAMTVLAIAPVSPITAITAVALLLALSGTGLPLVHRRRHIRCNSCSDGTRLCQRRLSGRALLIRRRCVHGFRCRGYGSLRLGHRWRVCSGDVNNLAGQGSRDASRHLRVVIRTQGSTFAQGQGFAKAHTDQQLAASIGVDQLQVTNKQKCSR